METVSLRVSRVVRNVSETPNHILYRLKIIYLFIKAGDNAIK